MGALLLAWMVFVIYGSLVPFDYRPVPLDVAWSRLMQAPMLRVGANGRADWIANGVLYLPMGFLATAWLVGAGSRQSARAAAACLGGLLLGCMLAFTVEFAQVFFPPRTVSLNDLLAEAIGTALGVLAALAGAHGFRALLGSMGAGGPMLRRLLAPAYLLLYVALALFPFDLVLDADEWMNKLHRGQVAWLLVDTDTEQGLARQLAKLLVEVATVAPIGAWWAARVAPGVPPLAVAVRAAVMGIALGAAIELSQLFILTGLSQGASVLTRSLGFAAGAMLWVRIHDLHVEALRAGLRRATAPLMLLYAPLLTLHFGWWRGPWMSVSDALHRLQGEIRFMPLYYHYFTTEASALTSLLAVASAYAPIGLFGWAWHLGAITSAMLAANLALVIESGRLMAASTKPDPSNLLIAAAAAWLMHHLSHRLTVARTTVHR